MTIGESILSLAPEAAAVIKDQLGVTDNEIAALDADDSIPYQTAKSQKELLIPVNELGNTPERKIREIWLGEHETLGNLHAKLPDWNPSYSKLKKMQVWQALMPEYFHAVTERISFSGSIKKETFTHKGVLQEDLAQTYHGLTWKSSGAAGTGHFMKVCGFAAGMLWHHVDVACLTSAADDAEVDADWIKDLIDGNTDKTIRVTDKGFGGTSWDWNIHILPPSTPSLNGQQFLLYRNPDWTGQAGQNMSAGGGVIRIQGAMVKRSALADYLFWWACQLYLRAKDFNSIWYMFMAILCMRNAISHIATTSSLLLHEFLHTRGKNHKVRCSQDRAEQFYVSVLRSMYGLPTHGGGPDGVASAIESGDRFRSENWSTSTGGSTGTEGLTITAGHYGLLNHRHPLYFETRLPPTCNAGVYPRVPYEKIEIFTPTGTFQKKYAKTQFFS